MPVGWFAAPSGTTVDVRSWPFAVIQGAQSATAADVTPQRKRTSTDGSARMSAAIDVSSWRRKVRDILDDGVALQALDAALAADATILHAAEWRLRARCHEVIDRQVADFNLLR